MIPVKIIVEGNQTRGREFIGFAKDQMRILENLMSFQGLKQSKRIVKPFPDIVVECQSIFTQQVIKIYAQPAITEEKEEPKRERLERKCLCLPHFSVGIVVNAFPETPTELWLEDGRFYYNLDICAVDKYVRFEGAYDANFGRYSVGQIVLVSMFDEMDSWTSPLDCKKDCLINGTRFDDLCIVPLHTSAEMRVWKDYEVVNG